MPPIGETLREARMRQRLDIIDVEERTKIRAKYLRALENEEWGLLPGPTFVRTFLRTYAEVVGIDPHLLVEEYRVNHEPREENDFQPIASIPARDRGRGGRGGGRGGPRGGGRGSRGARGGGRGGPRARGQGARPPGGGVIAAALLAALLAFLLALGLLGGSDEPGDGERAGSATAETTPRPAKQRRRPRATPAPTGVDVRIAPVEETYACIDTGPDTAVIFEGTLDSTRTFRNRRMLRLNLGKRSARITLNGKPVPVEDSGDPLGLELRRGGSTELASGDRPCA
jgi:cytoskeleton protein RodZ